MMILRTTLVVAFIMLFISTTQGFLNGFADETMSSGPQYVFQTEEEMKSFAKTIPRELPSDEVYLRDIEATSHHSSTIDEELMELTPDRSLQTLVDPTAPPTLSPTVYSPTPVYSLSKQCFNGSSNKLIGTLTTAPTNYMTISLWLNTTSKSAYMVSFARSPSNYNGEAIFDLNTGGKLDYWEYLNGYGLNFAGVTAVNTGKRTHVAIVKDNLKGYLYVNGKLDASSTTTFATTVKNLALNLGNDARGKSNYLKGCMDNLKIYNTALSATDIQNLYTNSFVPPTMYPTFPPTTMPSNPTIEPTVAPSTSVPTKLPTVGPTVTPTKLPTAEPTVAPTKLPSATPTLIPTQIPTVVPSLAPIDASTYFPQTIFSLDKICLDGATNKVYSAGLPNSPDLSANQLSFSFWVNTTTKSSVVFSLSRSPSNFNGEFIIDITSAGKVEVWEYNNGYGLNFIGNAVVTTGKRVHIGVVKNGNVGTIYVNGNVDATSTVATAVTNNNIYFNIGNDYRNTNAFFKGCIDNINVYNFALSATQMRGMYDYFVQPPTPLPTFAPTMYPTNPTFEPTMKPTAGPTIMPPTVPVVLSGVNRAPTIGFQIIDALASGDATPVSGDELRRKYLTVVQTLNTTRQSIISAVFTNSSTGKKYTSVTWNPGHDSCYFTIADAGNTHNLFATNYQYSYSSYSSSPVTLAAAGFYGETARYAAFGNNPFAVPLASDSTIIMKNVITWLNKGVDPSSLSSFKVTIAHLPGKSSYWFSHDIPTHAWFASSYPKATVNAINACDNTALDGCLVGSNLLVIGLQVDRIDDSAVTALTTDVTQVGNAVRTFLENGGAVMYVHYYRVGNTLSDQLLPLMGLSKLSYTSYTNYWSTSGLLNANPYTYTEGVVDTLYNAVRTLHGITPLTTSDICTTETVWTSCTTNAGFNRKIKNGVDNLRSILGNFDNAAFDLFSSPVNKYVLEKMLVLLGDKYRTAAGATDDVTTVVKYPLAQNNWVALAQFMFADSSLLYTRKTAPAQDDLGTVYCSNWNTLLGSNGCADYKNFADTTKVTRYNNLVVQDAGIYPNDVWTSTGAFAIPGVPFTVTRLDDRADITLYVVLWYQRSGTTKSLEADGSKPGYYQYSRPQYMRSPYVLLTKGKTVTVTSPTGGPIYFGLVSSGVTRTSSLPLQASFSNVARHPTILDVSDSSQVSSMVSAVKSNPIPIIDLKAPGMEMHMRSDFFLDNLKADADFMIDYSGDNGVQTLLYDWRFNYLEPQMTLAGFKAPGKELTESLPQTVQTACRLLKWNCTDTSVHQYNGIQHANYDDRSLCGSGCSGNPFDMSWSIQPMGWGESHELGHNMQQSLLQISWLPTGVSKNLWSNYQGRAGENSNNIFPYHNKWRYYRLFKNYTGAIQNSRGSSISGFVNLQSSYARINKTVSGVVKQVIYDSSCAIPKSYPLGTSLSRVVQDVTYADSSYAADNDARMDFYLQLPMIMTGDTVVKGQVQLTNGFEIFTLLYQGLRTLKYLAQNEARWKQYRDTIGFGLFNRTCAATDPCYAVYGTSSVTSMVGNDYVLVMMTFLSGYDFRPYFNLRGLSYSFLAENQVLAHIASGVANKGPVPLDYFAINQYPPASVVGGSDVKKVTIDGVSAWPFSSWSPSNCADTTGVLTTTDSKDNSSITDNKLWLGLIIAGSILVGGILIAIIVVKATALKAPPAPKEETEEKAKQGELAEAKKYQLLSVMDADSIKFQSGPRKDFKHAHSLDMDDIMEAVDDLEDIENHQEVATTNVEVAL